LAWYRSAYLPAGAVALIDASILLISLFIALPLCCKTTGKDDDDEE
jgi:hypothetical protein